MAGVFDPRGPMSGRRTILLADDDEGHAFLIRENLEAAGVRNPIRHFRDGQALLDFFYATGPGDHARPDNDYVILLDIRMPKVDGVGVLKRMKADPVYRQIPILMLTTTDDQREVRRCYGLGCNVYIRKPVDYERFSDAIVRLGRFMDLVVAP